MNTILRNIRELGTEIVEITTENSLDELRRSLNELKEIADKPLMTEETSNE